jgi:hypothetical protein
MSYITRPLDLLTSGESLLLHPLEEKPDHRRNYIVITARIISPVE